MGAQKLLGRLERVCEVVPRHWRAICPAHQNKRRTQSLSIRELEDGTVLLKCFAGCNFESIVTAVDLQPRDLFPPRHIAPMLPRHAQRPNHWHAVREAVQTLMIEPMLIAIVADDIAAGRGVSPADADRCALAARRIREALEACK